MGAEFATIVGWAFGLILVYLLLVHGGDTVNITNSGAGGGVSIIKALQGR